MNRRSDRVRSNHETYFAKLKSQEGCRSPTVVEREFTPQQGRTNCATEPLLKSKHGEKSPRKQILNGSEVYRVVQALLLAFFVLLLSYHGVRYGRTEYSVLDNGQTVRGYVSSQKAVVTLSLGYSASHSLISSVAVCLLIYSLVSKKPRWSLPLIVLYLADLVCDASDAIVAIWLFFTNIRFIIASFYTAGVLLLIFGEMWFWLGVLRLYEQRTFK